MIYICTHQLGNFPCPKCPPEDIRALPDAPASDSESPGAKAYSNAKTTIGDLKRGLVPEPVVRDLRDACDRALEGIGLGRAIAGKPPGRPW